MKTLILILTITLTSSLLYCQSSIVYGTGTNLDVQTGADICADSKTINGTYTGGGTFCEGALPVELISFTSSISLKGRDVTLLWKTDKEINNSGFNVERKISGTTEWEKIGFREGKGTVNIPTNYSFEDKKLQTGKYIYRLKQIDYNGSFVYYDLNNEVEIALPKKYNLSQNYPNPFNPSTMIDFDLPFDSKVSLILYDMTGREVKTLVNDTRTAGYYTVNFNASSLASGMYFYRIMTKSVGKDFVATKKMMLIK